MVTTTSKIGVAITVTVVFPSCSWSATRQGRAVNTPHAIFGLEMCYLFAPVILVFVRRAMFFGYGWTPPHHAIRQALEARDAGPPALDAARRPNRPLPGDPVAS